MTLAVAVPATFGLIAFAPDILAVLFQWGVFNARDVEICTPVVIAAVAGLPFFSIATFATRGFHSAKDTKTPVKISACSFAANIALSLALMHPFGAAGLAAANAGAAALQAHMLSSGLRKKFGCARNLQRGAQNLRGELRYDRRRRRRAVRSRRIFGRQGSRALFMRRYNSRRCRRLLRVSHAV